MTGCGGAFSDPTLPLAVPPPDVVQYAHEPVTVASTVVTAISMSRRRLLIAQPAFLFRPTSTREWAR